MRHHRETQLPEGSIAAPEMLKRSRTSTGLWAYLGGVATTVATIVIASVIVREIDNPDRSRWSALEFAQSVNSFKYDSAPYREELRHVADDQRVTTMQVEDAVSSGESAEQVHQLLIGTQNERGLQNKFDNYKAALNGISLLIMDVGKTFHPEVLAFDGYKQNLLRVSQADMDCLTEDETPSVTGVVDNSKVDCIRVGMGRYELDTQLVHMKACEDGIELFMHDMTARLELESEEESSLAEDVSLFSSFRRLFDSRIGNEPERRKNLYWKNLVEKLNSVCGANVDATLSSPSQLAMTLYHLDPLSVSAPGTIPSISNIIDEVKAAVDAPESNTIPTFMLNASKNWHKPSLRQ